MYFMIFIPTHSSINFTATQNQGKDGNSANTLLMAQATTLISHYSSGISNVLIRPQLSVRFLYINLEEITPNKRYYKNLSNFKFPYYGSSLYHIKDKFIMFFNPFR